MKQSGAAACDRYAGGQSQWLYPRRQYQRYMTARAAYEEKIQAQFEEFTAEIEKLKEKAHAAKKQAEVDYADQIRDLETLRKDLEKQLETLRASGDEAWGEVQIGIDKATGELKRALDRALVKLKGL